MNKTLTSIVFISAGAIALVFFARQLVSEHAVPTFSEYAASSTPLMSRDIASSSASAGAMSSVSLDGLPFAAITTPTGIMRAYVASTSASREQGLSGTDPLPDRTGMLFVFDKPDKYGFWMKDMRYAIDIVWISPEKKIVGVARAVSPETFPMILVPTQQVLYVLEVNASSSDRLGLTEGATLKF